MKLALLFLAASLACLVYAVVRRLPLPPEPPPPQRRSLLHPLERLMAGELEQARLPISPRRFVQGTVLFSALGAVLASPFRSHLLMLISACAFGLLPYQLVRARIGRRSRVIQAAVEPALIQIAKLCEVRHHPFLALSDAAGMLDEPLRSEFLRALLETQAGIPLEDALRALAHRCCNNFYLHQLAELVALNVRAGGDLAGSLQRLASRLRTMEELKAEETAELFGYKWLTRLLFGAALAPLPYWALTGSGSLRVFTENAPARALLIWVVLSGLAIASLPYWLAIED